MTFAPSAHHHSGDPRQPDSAGGICVNDESVHSSGNTNHDDCIQTWQKGGTSGGPPYNWTIANNEFVMNTTATQNKSWHMLEQLGTGYVNIYGNLYVGLQGASGANGIAADNNNSGATFHIYGNTIVEKAGGPNNLFNISGSGSYYLSDNIIYSTDAGNALTGGETFTSRDHNLWYGAGIPSCSGFTGDICGSNPLFTNYSGNDFSQQATSPAIGAGANLGSSYNQYPLPETTWPNPTLGTRPATGAWDAGAYQY
jgi:hypothetical protein